ncbi:CHAT domain-containing protein [Streptomyces sp. NPDC059193]|uniref:CHAT domain-containing protein n=1 Tax=Streptomyces sp. NPDC059193 TaxID=3346763 RepID=UPI0036C2A00B
MPTCSVDRLESLRLAVLSACETGRVGLLAPDEAIGFPTTLIGPVAAAAVSSLWAVPQTVTAELMVRFAHACGAGAISFGEALRPGTARGARQHRRREAPPASGRHVGRCCRARRAGTWLPLPRPALPLGCLRVPTRGRLSAAWPGPADPAGNPAVRELLNRAVSGQMAGCCPPRGS